MKHILPPGRRAGAVFSRLLGVLFVGLILWAPPTDAVATAITPVPGGPFNALVFGDYRSQNADTHGGLIVGGRVELSSFGVNTRGPSAFGLWSAGGGTVSNGHVWGHLTSNVRLEGAGMTGGQVFAPGNVVGLDSYIQHYRQLSTTWASDATARAAVRDPFSGLVLAGDKQASRHVFNVNAADLSAVRVLDIRDIDPDEELVINIHGDQASFTNLDLSESLGRFRTLLNYVDATIVHFKNTSPWADILAPWATITGESGHIQGTLVAGAFFSTLELHMGKTDFWKGPVQGVPLPGVLPMMALGLLALWAVRRRWPRRVALALEPSHR